MKRIQGGKDIALVECINPRIKKYRVRWDIQPYTEDNHDGVTFIEHEFGYKPSLDEIKDVILSWYNKEIDKKIASEFVWNNLPVWLSSENQFNYKAAYDLAIQTNGSNLPVTFKFGDTKNPVYYTFSTINELTDFYVSAMMHIDATLKIGWKEKDNINWSVYESYLQ